MRGDGPALVLYRCGQRWVVVRDDGPALILCERRWRWVVVMREKMSQCSSYTSTDRGRWLLQEKTGLG